MNLFASSPQWIVWLLAALLAAAAVQDAVQLRISNVLTVPVFVLALAAMALSGPGFELWQNFAMFAAVLAAGTWLFSRHALGGGDVKLLAAVSLWADGWTALRLLVTIAMAGGILALAILFLRTVVSDGVAARVKTLRPRAGIPYGIAIAAGTLLAITVSRV
jgi:prepilin peptidase CpaA